MQNYEKTNKQTKTYWSFWSTHKNQWDSICWGVCFCEGTGLVRKARSEWKERPGSVPKWWNMGLLNSPSHRHTKSIAMHGAIATGRDPDTSWVSPSH